MILSWVFALATISVFIWVRGCHLRLNHLKKNYGDGLLNIERNLKQRYDLVTECVDLVRSVMPSEKALMVAVLEARTRAMSALDLVISDPLNGQEVVSLNYYESLLRYNFERLLLLAESRGELQTDEQLTRIRAQFLDQKKKIASQMMIVNEAGAEFNAFMKRFPQNSLAKVLGMREALALKVEEPKIVSKQSNVDLVA
jgi:LemA protein